MKKQLILSLLILFSGVLLAQKSPKQKLMEVKPLIEDHLRLSENAVISGFIGEKLDASYQNRILAQDYERLISPFRARTETTCWQSEFWGKWFTSAILAYRYRPELQLKEVLDKAVAGLMATQTPDGYIGNYSDERRFDNWDIWGMKYCMLGMLGYYDITNDAKVLLSAEKLADYLIKTLTDKNVLIISKGNHRGMAATSVLEPICLLYTRTANKRYLDFAKEIVRQWETPDGPQLITKSEIDVSKRFPKTDNWYGPKQGQKAYEMMSCYEGLLELYRLTGLQVYKTAVEKTWKNILDTEINVAGSGAAVECWFGGKQLQAFPINHFQETCVTATWIKLSQQLLRLTGEARYADAIEQSYYNALLGAMTPDGSNWAKYTPLSGQRMEGNEQCGMGLNCCTASGPRGLFTFPLTVVMSMKDGVQVNFFTEGKSELKTPGNQKVVISQVTDYPVSGKVSIKVNLSNEEQMAIGIRIPAWSMQSVLSVNTEAIKDSPAGQIALIHRNWKNGDVISLELDMRGRLVRLGEKPENIAILRGPIVLARDTRLQGPFVDAVINPVLDENGFVPLELIKTNQPNIWMQFGAKVNTESYKEKADEPVQAVFCDYASAGNTVDEHSIFRVWFTQLINPRTMPEE